MRQSMAKLAFAACIILFALALAVSLLLPDRSAQTVSQSGSSTVVLSEIVADNCVYPAPDGRYLDFIELCNRGRTAVDISGWMLADTLDSIGYTFPAGTVLQPGQSIVCWCDKDGSSDAYASFGISRQGDIVYLYNTANVAVDEVSVPRTAQNEAYARTDDGAWTILPYATPGFENSQTGYAAWLRANGGGSEQIGITELMAGCDYAALDETGRLCDWIELYNAGDTAVVLDGAYLSDDAQEPLLWQIPSLTIEAGEYAVICCTDSEAALTEAPFALARSGGVVTLTGKLGNLIAQVEYPALEKDQTWALRDGIYAATAQVSPGFENSEAGYRAWLSNVGWGDQQIVISEVMTANRSSATDASGSLSDWIELYNAGDTTAVLDGAYLSDDTLDPMAWQIPSLSIEPGEYAVIFCSGDTAQEGEAPFALARTGCTVTLTGAVGNTLCSLDCTMIAEDRSLALFDDSYMETDRPTPGYANTEEGYAVYLAEHTPEGPLMISEVMPSNAQYLRQSDGGYYDWIELYNGSAETLELSDYTLSDDADEPAMFRLPAGTLEPGERLIVICSGGAIASGQYIQAPFTLSRQESWVYLTGPDGRFCDYLRVYDVPYQGSVGRADGQIGTCYFATPTPGASNGAGVASISATPALLTPDGVYDGVQSVAVELSGAGELRYTLDGSTPTASSALYAGPIVLTQTTVVRAACFEPGKLRSDVITAAYIINENHTLPVLSLTAEPSSLFGPSGLYVNYTTEREVPCNLKLFENGTGFSIDCGLKMHGHTGLQLPKKSFKVNFRGRYGSDVLSYPVYGEDAPQIYDSLCIRAGQDNPNAIIRDELFTSLCREASDSVLTQRDKYCILYINGRYYGIYCLKEAFSETYYAENKSVPAESVSVIQAPASTTTEMFEIIQYCQSHNLAEQEHYDYVASRVDVESLIDWMIFEGYSTNGDVQQNLRYFKSSENGDRWQFAFYDLDWSFYYSNPFRHVLSTDVTWQHLPLTRGMMKNAGFRQQFLQRLSELMETTLSDENVLSRIDDYEALLAPEVERDRLRWNSSYSSWQYSVNSLRRMVTNGLLQDCVAQLRTYIGLTNEEAQMYFGRWVG